VGHARQLRCKPKDSPRQQTRGTGQSDKRPTIHERLRIRHGTRGSCDIRQGHVDRPPASSSSRLTQKKLKTVWRAEVLHCWQDVHCSRSLYSLSIYCSCITIICWLGDCYYLCRTKLIHGILHSCTAAICLIRMRYAGELGLVLYTTAPVDMDVLTFRRNMLPPFFTPALTMKTVWSSQTLAPTSTRRHYSEDQHRHLPRRRASNPVADIFWRNHPALSVDQNARLSKQSHLWREYNNRLQAMYVRKSELTSQEDRDATGKSCPWSWLIVTVCN
jgi:hypothetical protein